MINNYIVETSYENNTIHVQVASHDKCPSDEEIINLLTHIFKTLGIEKDQKTTMLSSSISKTPNKIEFNIDVGKGVILKIEIPILAKGETQCQT